jgi:hypothetical protein
MTKPYKYLRKQTWWVGYVEADGKKVQRSTGYSVDQEAKAEKVRHLIESRLTTRAEIVGQSEGPLTVRIWAKSWIETRRLKGIPTADDYEAQLNRYILPRIGDLKLEAVTPQHVAQVLADTTKQGLAPRTIRHVYFTMHAMFRKAIPRLLDTNPCSIDSEDLPSKIDKDPEWRASAVFTKDELVKIISADGVPEDRRTFYGLLFLGAMRFGEVAALRWRHYDGATTTRRSFRSGASSLRTATARRARKKSRSRPSSPGGSPSTRPWPKGLPTGETVAAGKSPWVASPAPTISSSRPVAARTAASTTC